MKNNEDIIRDFYEHIISGNLLGNLEDFVSKDCTVWADGKSEKVGVNGMKDHLEAIRHTYPDYRMKILRQFVSGDYKRMGISFPGHRRDQRLRAVLNRVADLPDVSPVCSVRIASVGLQFPVFRRKAVEDL